MSNVYDIELQRYKNLKIRVCGKDSIPLADKLFLKISIYFYQLHKNKCKFV